MDLSDPSKRIVHCDLHKLTYTVAELMRIGDRILKTEILTHMHIYIVSQKVFKTIKDEK